MKQTRIKSLLAIVCLAAAACSGLMIASTLGSETETRYSIPAISFEEREAQSSTRLYITAFQSYFISVVDPASGRSVHEIPVTSQQAGVAVAPDGTRLYVVDGQDREDGYLRILDTRSWKTIHEEAVADRAVLIGGNPVSLSSDGRWLVVQHHSYDENRPWQSLFDTKLLTFRPELASRMPTTRFRSATIAGRPGHPRVYAASESSMIALNSENLATLWTTEAPKSWHAPPALASRGDVLYGLYPQVEVGCPCTQGRVQVKRMSLQLRLWGASTGRTIEKIELTERLSVPKATIGRGYRGYLSISPDGSRLYIAWENRIWALNAQSLGVQGELALPFAVDGMCLSVDGKELYVLPTTAAVKEPVRGLWTIDADRLSILRNTTDWPRLWVTFMFAAPAPGG